MAALYMQTLENCEWTDCKD